MIGLKHFSKVGRGEDYGACRPSCLAYACSAPIASSLVFECSLGSEAETTVNCLHVPMQPRRGFSGVLLVSLLIHLHWSLCWVAPASRASSSNCHRLTIVLVTSPIPSHPSTELIDQVIQSFDLVEGLEACPLIIVADGFQIREGKPAWNQGRIDESSGDRYLRYIDALKSKYESAGSADARRAVKVIGPLTKRVNFGHALLAGLSEVRTEFVLVVQHDRVFAEPFAMDEVLRLFDAHHKIRYVGFQTVPDYVTYAVSKYGGWARCKVSDQTTGLIPCFIWYDSTHVCRAQDVAALIEKEVKPGEFIESSFGCRLLASIQQKKDEWSFAYHMENYGVFLYYEPTVRTEGRQIKNNLDGKACAKCIIT